MMAGEIHPITRYVMNYLTLLVVYSDTFDKLLDDDAARDVDASHGGADEDEEYLQSLTPLGRCLVKLMSYLEEKSKLYVDGALQCIFSMNNTLHIVQKSTLSSIMTSEEDVKQRQIVEDRARNISHNVRCTECGSQSIEDSQADVAVLLRRLIRDEIKSGKSDKEIYKKLEDDFGETVLYAPKFDLQTAAIWLSPVIVGGVAAGMWAYQKHRQRTNVHIMALNLVRGVPLTPREKETMIDILTPPPPPRRWWWPIK